MANKGRRTLTSTQELLVNLLMHRQKQAEIIQPMILPACTSGGCLFSITELSQARVRETKQSVFHASSKGLIFDIQV